MYLRKIIAPTVVCLLFASVLCSSTASTGAANKERLDRASASGEAPIPTPPSEPRDEKLWKRALAIHRKAIVIDTHNDVTTPMTNDDYDLSGPPPVPYRTSIERMKQGGLTGEFFSLYVRPWYVAHGGAAHARHDRFGVSRG